MESQPPASEDDSLGKPKDTVALDGEVTVPNNDDDEAAAEEVSDDDAPAL